MFIVLRSVSFHALVSPVGRFAGSFRPESFRPGFRGGSIRPFDSVSIERMNDDWTGRQAGNKENPGGPQGAVPLNLLLQDSLRDSVS